MIKKATCLSLLAMAAWMTGCVTHVGYTAYDRPYGDYHQWGPGEVTYYNQWVGETHRPYRDYRRLNRHDQDAYWQWRHSHQDRH